MTWHNDTRTECEFCHKQLTGAWVTRHTKVCVENPDVWQSIKKNIDAGNGRAITSSEWARRKHIPSAAYLTLEFGSWDALAEKCDLQPPILPNRAHGLDAPLGIDDRLYYWDRENEHA